MKGNVQLLGEGDRWAGRGCTSRYSLGLLGSERQSQTSPAIRKAIQKAGGEGIAGENGCQY